LANPIWMKSRFIPTNLTSTAIFLSITILALSLPATQCGIGLVAYAQPQETEWNGTIMELIEILERDDYDAKEKKAAAEAELKKLRGFIDHLYYRQKDIQSTITLSFRLLETLTQFSLMETRHFRIPLPSETSPGTHDLTFPIEIDALVYDRNCCRDILARCYTVRHQHDQAVRIVMDSEDTLERSSEWIRVGILQTLRELARLRGDESGRAYYQVAIEKLRESIRDEAEAKRRKERAEYSERTKRTRIVIYALVLLIPGITVFLCLDKALRNPLLFGFDESSVKSRVPKKSLEIRGRTALRGFVTHVLLYGALLGMGGFAFGILLLSLLASSCSDR
jgi:hypothetical protein